MWCTLTNSIQNQSPKGKYKNAEKQSKTDLYKNDICTVTTSTKNTIEFFSARSNKKDHIKLWKHG